MQKVKPTFAKKDKNTTLSKTAAKIKEEERYLHVYRHEAWNEANLNAT
jgi:hypothetical protein